MIRERAHLSAFEQEKEKTTIEAATAETGNKLGGVSTVPVIIYERRTKKKSLDQVALRSPSSSLSLDPLLATFVQPQQKDRDEKQRVYCPIDTDDKSENVQSHHQSWMPEKHRLEFILDVLQRSDTYKLFGHPVDPKEDVGYDVIINEPMDFSTIRAKLQEDMYTTLQEFEKDVFLVSTNAMEFNLSGSIFFRQARAIHDLSKRVFHSLRNDPSKIESVFSLENSQPSGCKARGETRTSNVGLTLYNSRPVGRPRNIRMKLAFHSNPSPNGSRNSRDCERIGDLCDRRLTYYTGAMATTVCEAPEQFQLVSEGIGYRESLEKFVKDLGPTPKKVAGGKMFPHVTMLLPQKELVSQQSNCTVDEQLGVIERENAAAACPAATAAIGMMTEKLDAICGSSNRMPLEIDATKTIQNVFSEPNYAPCRSIRIDNGSRGVQSLGGDTIDNSNTKFCLNSSLGARPDGFLGFITDDAYGEYLSDHHIVSSQENQNQVNYTAGTINYLTKERSLTNNTYPNKYLSNQVDAAHHISDYTSRTVKATVYPSVIVKPSSFSKNSCLWPDTGSRTSSQASLVEGATFNQTSRLPGFVSGSAWSSQASFGQPATFSQTGSIRPGFVSCSGSSSWDYVVEPGTYGQTSSLWPGSVSGLGSNSPTSLVEPATFSQTSSLWPGVVSGPGSNSRASVVESATSQTSNLWPDFVSSPRSSSRASLVEPATFSQTSSLWPGFSSGSGTSSRYCSAHENSHVLLCRDLPLIGGQTHNQLQQNVVHHQEHSWSLHQPPPTNVNQAVQEAAQLNWVGDCSAATEHIGW